MGTLMGHILPGTFFAIFSIWWGFCLAVRYFQSRHSFKQPTKPNLYRSTTTYPCACCPSAFLRKIPLESYIKLICISIGILGEVVTGLRHPYDEYLKRNKWIIIEVNTQHITMFFSFGIASFIEILVHAKYPLPNGIEFLANLLAFGVEGFLFHFHLHGRDEVDIHVHTLLVYNIGFCILAGIWEYNRPHEIMASYTRAASTLLQGAWFYAAGFILYFPSDNPYWRWQPGHSSILMITVLFIWLTLLVCLFFFVQCTFIWFIMKRRHQHVHCYDVLHENDIDENQEETAINGHPLQNFKTNNGKAVLDMNNVDDDESDN